MSDYWRVSGEQLSESWGNHQWNACECRANMSNACGWANCRMWANHEPNACGQANDERIDEWVPFCRANMNESWVSVAESCRIMTEAWAEWRSLTNDEWYDQWRADMKVPSESFRRSSLDSRTCYPSRATNEGLIDGSHTTGAHALAARFMADCRQIFSSLHGRWQVLYESKREL